LAVAVAWRRDRRDQGSGVGSWLALLAACHLAAMLVIHPRQGLFRDWDVATGTGVALSCWAAWRIGGALTERPRAAGAAMVIGLIAGGSTISWMLLNSSLDRSVTRIQAYVSEPPRRTDQDLGLSYRYLGIVAQDSGLDEIASRDFQLAATLVPSESNLALWAGHEVHRGRLQEAQRIYRLMTGRLDNYDSWLALARCSAALRDTLGTAPAPERAPALPPPGPPPG